MCLLKLVSEFGNGSTQVSASVIRFDQLRVECIQVWFLSRFTCDSSKSYMGHYNDLKLAVIFELSSLMNHMMWTGQSYGTTRKFQ